MIEHDPKKRKALPVATGVLAYFPDALLAVAEVSRIGNDQHNPGEPLHWAKEKSQDEDDALVRHLLDHYRGLRFDVDGGRVLAKLAWRALALLQRGLDREIASQRGRQDAPEALERVFSGPQPDPLRAVPDGRDEHSRRQRAKRRS